MRYIPRLLPGLLLLFLQPAAAQLTTDSTISLDLLKSPASPAFNILGIAQSDIERPTDLKTFALSIQNATNNFTSLPESYAFQVAPFLMGRKQYSLNEFDSNRTAFKQSFQLSAGYTFIGPKGKEKVDSLKTTKIGLGIKFSIIRPKWTEKTRTRYQALRAAQVALIADMRSFEQKHGSYTILEEKKKQVKELELIRNRTPEQQERFMLLLQEIRELDATMGREYAAILNKADAFAAAKKAATAFKTERKGFFLDFSGGFALDFPDNRFNYSKMYRGGAWLTGGHENGNKGLSSLFIVRYLYNPETVFAAPAGFVKGPSVSTLDMGGRLILDASAGKLAFSSELLYRSILGASVVDPSWRFVLNAEYDLRENQKLTFAFGRDFDGTISKGGNLIAMINLISAFGGGRKIAN